jgi:hypothetical protein
MTRAEAVTFLRGVQKYYKSYMQPKASEACKLAADALEAVERMEAEREHWKSIGGEEELRKVSDRINEKLDIENPQGFAERGLVASGYCEGLQECIDYIDEAVDEIKARREAR